MKSIVCHGPKDIRIEERPSPVADTKQVLIRVNSGGICGSDLHYYNNGGFGEIRLREPMILGHEISGHITALGEGVAGLSVGDLVAVNPSRPCNDCEFCAKPVHQCRTCAYGSAMRFPHIQGAFASNWWS
jgi:L-idonate 5-dehydrogenase